MYGTAVAPRALLPRKPPTTAQFVGACALAAVAGCGTATQSGVNVTLSRVLELPQGSTAWMTHACATTLAALTSFSGGFALLLLLNALVVARSRARVPVLWRGVRWYQCMGGLLGALNVVSVILATASVGYALTSVAKMCASLCAASTIDHLGVFGFELKRCDRSAALSLAVVVFGAALSVLGGSNHRDANDQGSSTLAILIGLLLAVTSGTVQPLQAATNRALAETIGGVKIRATLVSFFGGAASLAVLASTAFQINFGGPPSRRNYAALDGRWWLLSGGAFGVYSVTMNILLPPVIGLAPCFCIQIVSNIAMSCILDAVGPFADEAGPPSVLRLVGIVVSLVGALCVRRRRLARRPDL